MKELLSRLQNVLNSELINSDVEFDKISIDSRTINKGNLFIAIKGEKHDGHKFIHDAIKKGSVALITEKKIKDIPQILVKDSTLALGKISNYYIKTLKPLTIGITGTNGKTSVTNLVGSILSEYRKTITSYGNFNNQIGLPLSILRLDSSYEICVLEMGASKRGDIKYLTDIACPKIVALLNVSPAHLEGFKNLENIVLTKEEILSNQGYEKTVILNKDDLNFLRWKKLSKNHNLKTISKKQTADYYLKDIKNNELTVGVPNETSFKLTIQQTHLHFIENILFSIACSFEAGASLENIIEGYRNYTGVKGRFYTRKGVSDSTVIDDTYNANPLSMKTSLESLISMKGVPWFIMGDMGELGEKSDSFHFELAEFAKRKGVKKLFYIGEYGESIIKGFGKDALCFETKDELISFVKNIISKNVNILIKASRFMKFETIADELTLRKD